MAVSPHYSRALPAIRPDDSRRILAEMIRAAFPGLSTEQRCRRAAQLLGIHYRNVRRLDSCETRGDAAYFLTLMKHLGVDQTLEIINRVTRS